VFSSSIDLCLFMDKEDISKVDPEAACAVN